MKKIATLSALLASSLFASDGAAVFTKCVACHGKDAKMIYSGKVPALAGQDKTKLIESMKGYKAGTINAYGMGVVMKAQAGIHLKSDEDIEAVAGYLSTLK